MTFKNSEVNTKSVTIQGIVVHLSFAETENNTAPQMVKDILKGAYLNKKQC